MHIFHSFFYRLPPTLLCVDRCLSGLKIAYDIMGEMRAKIESTEACKCHTYYDFRIVISNLIF